MFHRSRKARLSWCALKRNEHAQRGTLSDDTCTFQKLFGVIVRLGIPSRSNMSLKLIVAASFLLLSSIATAEQSSVIDDKIPKDSANTRMPTVQQVLDMLESMDGISDEEKEQLRKDLLSNNFQQDNGSGRVAGIPGRTVNLSMRDMVLLLSLLGTIALIFLFFVHKLYKSLADRERRQKEKKQTKRTRKTK